LLGIGFFLGEMDVGFEVAGERREFVVRGDLVFGAFAVAQDGLRSFLIVPKIGLCDAGFEGFQTLAMWRGVKDSSEPWRCAALKVRSGAGDLRESLDLLARRKTRRFFRG
jgi:hypothetical protein